MQSDHIFSGMQENFSSARRQNLSQEVNNSHFLIVPHVQVKNLASHALSLAAKRWQLCWLLLTTLEVTAFEQAVEKLEWYVGRWGIEVYHRTLKSGCKIEERQWLGLQRRDDMTAMWKITMSRLSPQAYPPSVSSNDRYG